MATFPALRPQVRSYTPGQRPNTPIPTINGDEISVRHSNGSTSYILRLGFRALTSAEHFSVLSHYNLHERFIPFDLPTEALEGSNLTFPSGYQWVYLGSPSTEVLPGQTNINVELELLAPYSI
jgi:hypothetical protein